MTDNTIKRMDIKEFRALGFLQEANRKFFHPLGLAMEVVIDDDTGEETLGGVWDYRDDPEGMFFGEGVGNRADVAKEIEDLRLSKVEARINNPSSFKVDEDGVQVV